MICTNCGHSQETGKFCGKCGTKFGEPVAANPTAINTEHVASSESIHEQLPPTEVAESNIHVEKIKAQSKMYGTYFVQQLKKPSLTFNDVKVGFSNGLISIILLGVLITLSLYAASRSYLFGYGPGFLSTFIGILIVVLITMGIALLSLFIISHFFGPSLSFKSIVSVYGAHLSPLLMGVAISLLLMLVKSYTFGNLLLSIIFLFTVFILPLYLISSLLTKKPAGVDPLYGFILYIVAFGILFMIFITVLADSTMGGYLDEFWYW